MGKKLLNGECKSSTEKCKGGKLESGVCKCNNGTLLFLGECLELKECPPRSIREGNTCKMCGYHQISEKNKCITCPKFSSVFGNKCKASHRLPPFVKKKPVIYLYPEEPMDISVKLNLKNIKFTAIYPKFY